MSRQKKKNRYHTLRPPGEAACCIACGVGTSFSAERGPIFEEREEWKSLQGKLAIVRSEEIESMYFQKEPWLWTSFVRASQLSLLQQPHLLLTKEKYRTVLYNPDTEHVRVTGISQIRMTHTSNPDPVPSDPQKARIDNPLKIPSNLKGFDRYLLVNMPRPELSDKDGLLAYEVHAHCWVLLDRVIGHELIEQKLKIFLHAVQQFWKKNRALWNYDQFDDNYDDPFYPVQNRLRETSEILEYVHCEGDLARDVDMTKNPVVVPEIQA